MLGIGIGLKILYYIRMKIIVQVVIPCGVGSALNGSHIED
jgi:hypothetical protein